MDFLLPALGLALIIGAVLWHFRGPRDPDESWAKKMLGFGGGGRGRGR